MIQLNPTVGVAPGTTTLSLGSPGALGDCAPDELWQYVTPPVVTEGYPSGVTATDADSIKTPTYWDPYQDMPQLKGLGDTDITSDAPRWGIVLFTGLATFAIVFGLRYAKHKRA